MASKAVQAERAQNLWASYSRKFAPIAKATHLDGDPPSGFDHIGGLAGPKEEVLTFACAATSPEVYDRWGTFPPSGLLLIGQRACGKRLLATALAGQTQTSFLHLRIPLFVMETLRAGPQANEMMAAWSQTLDEMPPLTVFFDELDFSQEQELGSQRTDLPIGPVMDFLLDLLDRTIAHENVLAVGSTSFPDTVRPALLAPGRFERVVEVNPIFPGDVMDALRIHAEDANKRAGRPLFEEIQWEDVVGSYKELSIGAWVRILHAVLRRKARLEAAGDEVLPVNTKDLIEETERAQRANRRLASVGDGTYI